MKTEVDLWAKITWRTLLGISLIDYNIAIRSLIKLNKTRCHPAGRMFKQHFSKGISHYIEHW